MTHLYFKVYKPYGYLSQFTGEPGDKLLGDLFTFPKDVYAAGRLDKDSEGLIILTNDNEFKAKLIDPDSGTYKRYWVQVDGDITTDAIEWLRSGRIEINHKGKRHRVAPAQCIKIPTPDIPERIPPIRYRKEIPTSWIELSITEGKNRQVRKMTAATGFPTLRLIRVQIDQWKLEDMQPGEVVPFII